MKFEMKRKRGKRARARTTETAALYILFPFPRCGPRNSARGTRVSGAATSGPACNARKRVPTRSTYNISPAKLETIRGTSSVRVHTARLDAFTKAVREPDAFNLASRTPPPLSRGEREGDNNWRNNGNYSATRERRGEEGYEWTLRREMKELFTRLVIPLIHLPAPSRRNDGETETIRRVNFSLNGNDSWGIVRILGAIEG